MKRSLPAKRVNCFVMQALLLLAAGCLVASPAAAQGKNEAAKSGTTNAPKSAAPATATPAGPQKEWKEAFDDWIFACTQNADGKKSCAISQTLSNTQTRQLIGAFSIGKDNTGKLLANLQTPLGFAVNEGIQLTIGSQPAIPVPVRTCMANGCLGIVELDQNAVGQLQKAAELAITLKSLQGTPVVVKFSAKGLAKALQQLLKEGT